MRVYSDSKVSDFLGSVTDEQSIEFMNEWNGNRDHREKIYISYDSTNKNSQAGNVSLMEYGHPKVDVELPIFNYAVASVVGVYVVCTLIDMVRIRVLERPFFWWYDRRNQG
jgi:hypothetical protein